MLYTPRRSRVGYAVRTEYGDNTGPGVDTGFGTIFGKGWSG